MKSQLNLDVELDEVQEAIEKSYDEYPYESNPFPLSHPKHLYVLGTLFGMQPADPEKCRVLELGCASGGNLIPMAMQLSGAQFFGVDLSARQVNEGKNLIKTLDLKNIKLEQKDILKVGGRIRKFDYIICHGVYSWVPENVREKILDICRRYLTDNGIAYVSYNTYPGWHMRESIRNMMQYHTAQFGELQDKINQARALLNFLAQAQTQGNVFGQYLKNESKALASAGDYYIAHEHLEGNNTPVYFHEFVQAAEDHELQYLSESEFGTMLASNFPQDIAQTLQRVGQNLVQMEQYMDFLRNRMFRSTLLCHKAIKLKRGVEPAAIKKFYIASPVKPVTGEADIKSSGDMQFAGPNGLRIGVNHPLTKAALIRLREVWPADISFSDLLKHSIKASGTPTKGAAAQLAADLLQAYTAGAVHINQSAADVCNKVSEKPLASALGREQASIRPLVANQRHQRVVLNEPLRQLLMLLDGEHTHEQLADALMSLIQDGNLQIRSEGKPISDQSSIRAYAEQFVPRMLNELAGNALLIA